MRLPTSVAPRHYDIDLVPVPSSRPELGFEEFHATVTIRVDVKESTKQIVLNVCKLQILTCRYNGVEVSGFRLLPDFDHLEIDVGHELGAGTSGELSITYAGEITTDSVGIYQNTYGGGKVFVNVCPFVVSI